MATCVCCDLVSQHYEHSTIIVPIPSGPGFLTLNVWLFLCSVSSDEW